MKKYIVAVLAGAVAIPAFAIKSSLIRNTADEEVFSIEYTDGAATVNIPDGTISGGAAAINTSTNVDLTAITPVAQGQLLLTPNATNTFVIGGVTNLLRLAVNVDGTTNGWKKIVTEVEP